jgi:predicted lipid-binding transport protein (Tim44 family)
MGMDFLTILFLVIAVVIFFRLRSVLGRRTGNERVRYDRYSDRETHDNVVNLPQRDTSASEELDEEAFARRLRNVVPLGSEVAQKLQMIAQKDLSFDPQDFLKGAKQAYEWIVTAFASGDHKVLKQLLSPEVYDGFAAALSEREKKGERIDFKFVGISNADIQDAEIVAKTAHVTIKFVSELITASYDSAGEKVDGDPTQIREVTDIWTFAREMNAADPNWRLVATSSEN